MPGPASVTCVLLRLLPLQLAPSGLLETCSRATQPAQQSCSGGTTRAYCVSDLPPPYFCTGDVLRATFAANHVVPDLLPPEQYAMRYDLGVKVAFPDRTDVIGTFVNRSLAEESPTVTFGSGEHAANQLLTLVMLDPDAPARWEPTHAPFLHWLVYNIRRSHPSTSGDVAASYMPPSPPLGTGLHRYVVLVLEHTKGKIVVPEAAERSSFELPRLMRDYHLQILGGTFFFSQS